MKNIPIIHRKSNMELVTKVMNSICRKYDCRVEYNAENDSIRYHGAEELKPFIAEEMHSLFAKA